MAAKDYTITAIANLTHGFSPTLLTELRLGYNRYRTNVQGVDRTTVTNQKLGIANPNPDGISTDGFANVAISGMPEMGNAQVFYPLVNTDNLMTLSIPGVRACGIIRSSGAGKCIATEWTVSNRKV